MLQKSRKGKIVQNLLHFAGKDVAINPAADYLADMLEHIFQCDHGTPVKTRQTPARRNWLRPWTSCNMPEDFQNLTKLKTNKVWERNFKAMFSFVLWCYILIYIYIYLWRTGRVGQPKLQQIFTWLRVWICFTTYSLTSSLVAVTMYWNKPSQRSNINLGNARRRRAKR